MLQNGMNEDLITGPYKLSTDYMARGMTDFMNKERYSRLRESDRSNEDCRYMKYNPDTKQYEEKIGSCVKETARNASHLYRMDDATFRDYTGLFGDAWTIGDKIKGEEVKDGTYKIGDLVIMSRGKLKSDEARGIPGKEQHIGYITRFNEKGVPIVRHAAPWNWHDEKSSQLDEPIDNIRGFTGYKPSRIIRPRAANPYNIGGANIQLDSGYKANEIEQRVLNALNYQQKDIQKATGISSERYQQLAPLLYGIYGAESDFGGSKRAVYRGVTPKPIQRVLKQASDTYDLLTGDDPKLKDKNILERLAINIGLSPDPRRTVHNYYVNDISQGPASIKSSNFFNIEDAQNPNAPASQTYLKALQGDTEFMNRKQNLAFRMLTAMGVRPDHMDNPEQSLKGMMSLIGSALYSNPNMTEDQIIAKYTGKKIGSPGFNAYKQKVESYKRNMNQRTGDEKVRTEDQNKYANLAIKGINVRDDIHKFWGDHIGKAIDYTPANLFPSHIKTMFKDWLGSTAEINNSHLRDSEVRVVDDLIRRAKEKGVNKIGYYDTHKEVAYNNAGESDVGQRLGPGAITKALGFDPAYNLKTTTGQARRDGNKIIDSYDFNDWGEGFGLMDEIEKNKRYIHNPLVDMLPKSAQDRLKKYLPNLVDVPVKGLDFYNIPRKASKYIGSPDGFGPKIRFEATSPEAINQLYNPNWRNEEVSYDKNKKPTITNKYWTNLYGTQ